MVWDVFCRVIDNYGDIGVCWRLAADLGSRGQAVRLWVDDPAPLSWMAPHGAAGVQVMRWAEPVPSVEPGEVVVEAFGCDPPPAFVDRMAARRPRPVWVNLEYLSAEAYVERSHRLPSPQANGLTKWFFYPGFTPRTGGLLREPGLMAEQAGFRRDAWLAAQGIAARPAERLVSLFCYDNPQLPELLARLAAQGPTLLLATAGAAQHQLQAQGVLPPTLRVHRLPWLDQAGFDRLLWACDLNVVRGEDSFVRAQWAGAPFLWHIYPQHDGAHLPKLGAFLDRFGASDAVRALWLAWNGGGLWPAALPPCEPWAEACAAWREHLLTQPDLLTQLQEFVRSKRLE